MYKIKTRLTALLTVLMLAVLLVPMGIFGNFALALDDDDFEAKVTLDYDSLFDQAYIVNPNWSAMSGTLSFQFRGITYTETYNVARHFGSFADAMNAFIAAHPNDVAMVTPVFILAPGTYSTAITVPYNAIILGNNAGMDPNVKSVTAQNVANVNQMASGWTAATRNTSTTFSATVNSTRTAAESATLNNSGNGIVRVVVDGVDFNIADNVTNVTDVSDAKHHVDMCIQNSVINITEPKYIFKNADAGSDVIRNGLYNVRMDGAFLADIFDELTCVMKMDGVYLANSSTPFISSANPVKSNIDFELANSFLYNLTTTSSPISLKTNKSYAHIARYTFSDNLFYHVGRKENNYGMVRFETQDTDGITHFSENYFEYNFYGNTIVAYPDSVNITLFNGNQSSYQTTSYTLNFNHNRVIGYRSIFPNHSSDKYTELTINADFNYNYYEYIDPYYGEFKGTKSLYSNAYKSKDDHLADGYLIMGKAYFDNYGEGGYIDPFDYTNLLYYTDWAMTTAVTDTINLDPVIWEIESVSFYDEVNYINIDYDAFGLVDDSILYTGAIIVGIEKGQTIAVSDKSVTFANSDITSYFMTEGKRVDTLQEGATYFLVADNGTEIYHFNIVLEIEGQEPTVTFSDSEYLYAPAVANLRDGTTYTTLWGGRHCSFTVGTNVFATLEEIFESFDNPTILLTSGNYDNITITKPCTIKGYNYAFPASVGSGVDHWNYGYGWGGSQNSIVSGITIGEMPEGFTVNVSGITLKGSVTDKVRNTAGTVNLSNSIIVSDNQTIFDIDNTSVSTAANTYNLSGVRVDKVADNGVLFGAVPSTLSLDNVHLAAIGLKSLFVNGWIANDVERSFTMINSRVENVTGDATLFGNLDSSTSDSNKSKYTVKNTVVMADEYTGTLVKLTPNCYKSVSLQDNIFVNESGSAALMEVDYNKTLRCKAKVKGNRVIGFDKGYTAINNLMLTKTIDVSGNYFSVYSEDFTEAKTGICPVGTVRCATHYVDYAMLNGTFNKMLLVYAAAVVLICIVLIVLWSKIKRTKIIK